MGIAAAGLCADGRFERSSDDEAMAMVTERAAIELQITYTSKWID